MQEPRTLKAGRALGRRGYRSNPAFFIQCRKQASFVLEAIPALEAQISPRRIDPRDKSPEIDARERLHEHPDLECGEDFDPNLKTKLQSRELPSRVYPAESDSIYVCMIPSCI